MNIPAKDSLLRHSSFRWYDGRGGDSVPQAVRHGGAMIIGTTSHIDHGKTVWRRHSSESWNPESHLKVLDSGFARNDDGGAVP